MYFIKNKNVEWKCINIYTVSDDSSENTLPQIATEKEEEKDIYDANPFSNDKKDKSDDPFEE